MSVEGIWSRCEVRLNTTNDCLSLLNFELNRFHPARLRGEGLPWQRQLLRGGGGGGSSVVIVLVESSLVTQHGNVGRVWS